MKSTHSNQKYAYVTALLITISARIENTEYGF